jgi:phage repressor protein C with HTH and peptisase S24 domain
MTRPGEGRARFTCHATIQASGECAVKFLSWAAKDKLLAIGSQDAALYPAVYRKPSEVRIVGRVIWASREFR